MKMFWWKVYFWLNVLLIALVTIAEFSYPTAPVGLFIADVVMYAVGIVGVYSYVFRKHIFESSFWKYFFWFTIVYSALFLLYAADPDHPIISYLSFLSYSDDKENLLITTLTGLVLSVPYTFAMYQLSQGRFVPVPTKEDEAKEKNKKWGMVQMALWGYSIVFILVMLIISLLPSAPSMAPSVTSDNDIYSGMIIFAPILAFWAWVAIEYKRYTWNWWKVTLILNSILFSGIIVFGSFFYDSAATSESSGDMDFFGIAQILIILTGLYVFGREQFKKEEVTIVEPPTPAPLKRSRRRKPQTSSEAAIGK